MSSYRSVLLCCVVLCVNAVIAIHWDHSVEINDDYRLLWSARSQDITIEVQVRTLGYVGLGFSKDGDRAGSDVAIGWIDKGQTYFQDRHIKKHGDGEPFVDPSQDYVLLLGYENATHTVMRFKRKLDTCDTSHDIPITNDTMRVIYMYHKSDPDHGSVAAGTLPSPQAAYKGYVPLSLTQRLHDEPRTSANMDYGNKAPVVPPVYTIELRNQDVTLPQADDTQFWCKVFEMQHFRQKQHLIKYEPVFDSAKSKAFLQHIILYECQGNVARFAAMSRESGRPCAYRNDPAMPCNAIVATWTRGSEGFTFPPEAGYPLDSAMERFYLMETHYNNPQMPMDLRALHMGPVADNSGLKLFYTPTLRKHDAGVLSMGMDPNWRHIIPPGHEKVISEGHCIDDCTRKSFPPQGISIFAVIMQTHNIGKEVKLRQVRKHEELLPIAFDGNVHAGYAEFRKISPPSRVLPGDSMIVECTYNSSARETITLGGITTREESCNVFAVYYPRQKKLSGCHSLPSLPTVLHSLGIEELAMESTPVLIASPPELAGMTLESRLVSYDWELQFDSFQKVTRSGSFRAVCIDARNAVLPGTDNKEHFSPALTTSWQTPGSQCRSRDPTTTHQDSNTVTVTEMATRRKNSEVESMSLSKATAVCTTSLVRTVLQLLLVQLTAHAFVIT